MLSSQKSSADVPVWNKWEHTLTSTKTPPYTNPYQEVDLSVVYTGPEGETINAYGFWNGGTTFKIRCMFPSPGTWSWTTTCNQISDAGLHNQNGAIVVTPYTDNNPLYQRGGLKVSDNLLYLTHANGEPFFWMADTAWVGPMAATQAEWEPYIQKRVNQKFNVIQMICGSAFGFREYDAYGNHPFQDSITLAGIAWRNEKVGPTDVPDACFQWNPACWQMLDQKVQYANDQGIVAFFNGIGSHPVHGFPKINESQVRRFARSFVARMMGNFVVFSPEADWYWTQYSEWSGNEMNNSTDLHLVTVHPEMTPATAVLTFHDKPYTDFAGSQTSMGWLRQPHASSPDQWDDGSSYSFSGQLAAQCAIEQPLALLNRAPLKPTINIEVVYDLESLYDPGHVDYDRYKQPYPPRLVRSSAYLSLLSGSKGITYGIGGVWNWGIQTNNVFSNGWDFPTALSMPSGDQMTILYNIFSPLEWWRMVPAPELVLNQPAVPSDSQWLTRMVLAKTPDGDLAVAYLQDNAEIQIDITAFSTDMQATWIDPLGIAGDVPIGGVSNSAPYNFIKPGSWEDAVLVLTPSDISIVPAPTGFSSVSVCDGSNLFVNLVWQDNSVGESQFLISRRDNGGPWDDGYASVVGSDVQDTPTGDVGYFQDANILVGHIYEYRVRTEQDGESSAWSSISSVAPSTDQTPYGGQVRVLDSDTPIQCEDFDFGGPALAYVDESPTNEGGQYRTNEQVDIAIHEATHLGYVKAGEWLEYTVNVTTAGSYPIKLRAADPNANGAQVHIDIDGRNMTGPITIQIPDPAGPWPDWQIICSGDVYLSPGLHLLRLSMDVPASNGWLGEFDWIGSNPPTSPPPIVLETIINSDAGGGIQRSIVEDLQIRFSEIVTIEEGTFEVRNLDTDALVTLDVITESTPEQMTVATLTFSGDQTQYGSLMDGEYQLTIDASKVHSSVSGMDLDGDDDGAHGDNYVFGDTAEDKFFRFFGDYDGDRDVDASDFAWFRTTMNKTSTNSAYLWFFSFDGDNDVDSVDLGYFCFNYGKILPSPISHEHQE